MFAIRSGNFQLCLMLATALAALVLPMAAEAYTPEGRQACTGDAFRLCSAEIPNVDRVRACLHRNKAQLSPGCRGFISPGAHRPRPSGPLLRHPGLEITHGRRYCAAAKPHTLRTNKKTAPKAVSLSIK